MPVGTTKELYFVEGAGYLPHRQVLHQKIIAKALEEAKPLEEDPYAALIGGGSGSGKSSVVAELLIMGEAEEEDTETSGYVLIDCDEIKKQLPEFIKMTNSDDEAEQIAAAVYVHDESSDIAEELLQECIKSKRNFIYDGTMKNFVKYDTIIKNLKQNGYSVTAYVVDIPVDIAIERVKLRALKEKRHIDPFVVYETHVSFADTFLRLKEQFDEYILYDNTGEEPEEIAYKDKGEPEVIVDPTRYQQFLEKAKSVLKDSHNYKM